VRFLRLCSVSTLAVCLLASNGCGPDDASGAAPAQGYQLAVQSGRQLPLVQDFSRVFPDASHGIANYLGKRAGPTAWTSEVGLYERYVLSLQFEITLDISRTQIVRSTQPQFVLTEIASITRTAAGKWDIKYGPHKRFGIEEWKKLARAEGDFGTFGLYLTKDEPIEGFKRVLMW
jgi:hypothetical protein